MTQAIVGTGDATVSEQEQAQAYLAELQRAIERFNRARLKTEELTRGVKPCRLPRDQVAGAVQQMRDTAAENEAAQQLIALQRLLLGRDPTPSESAAGVAGGMGLPVIIPIAVVAGAASLTSLFTYLSNREERIQRELNPGMSTLSDILGNYTQWLLPTALVAGAVVGGWWLLKGKKGRGGKALAVKAEPDENPADEDEDEAWDDSDSEE